MLFRSGVMRLAEPDVGRSSLVVVGVLALLAGASSAAERRRQRREERKAGGAEVLVAVDRACRFGERPVEPRLASAARAWIQQRARYRRRMTRWAVSAFAAGVAAGLAVGYAGHRPVGYGIAVLFGLLAVAQPLNERSFTRYLAQADDVLRDGPDSEHG